MSKDKDKRTGSEKRGRGGGLSPEDTALWRFVTRDVKPARGKARVREVEAESVDRGRAASADQADARRINASQPTRNAAPPPAETKPRAQKPLGDAGPAKAKPSPAVAPIAIERRKARRIARGAEDIEARLDLHGLTQDEAHGALTRFIHRCHAQGMKTVLVITGKGSAGSGGEAGTGPGSRKRGVLRQNVPRWLHEGGLAALVVGFSAASARHGGDGALYVTLRKRR